MLSKIIFYTRERQNSVPKTREIKDLAGAPPKPPPPQPAVPLPPLPRVTEAPRTRAPRPKKRRRFFWARRKKRGKNRTSK